jgi:hypothetical protein
VRRSLVIAAVGALALAPCAPALAAPTGGSTADVVGNVRITSATTAEVSVRYTCDASDPAVALWVAVKQGDRLVETPDHTGTSSANADAYSQSHAEVGLLKCDGKNHVATFTVNQLEGPAPWGGFGTLRKGEKTYVQFCLTPTSATSEADVISSMEFVTAR